VWSSTCLVLFLPVEVVCFAKDLTFHQNSVKEGMTFLGKFYRNRYWVFGAKLPNVIAGTFTLLRKFAMSGDSYSAQLKVRKRGGEPHSRIMHLSSLCLRNQYCLVPQTDWSIVHKFASRCSSQVSTLSNSEQTDMCCLLVDFSRLYTPVESSCISFCQSR